MDKLISACGVICSGCGAYQAASRGSAHQQKVADAWQRIYGLDVKPEQISCGGCLSPDDQVYHTSTRCSARRCCLTKKLKNCAECPVESCELLEKARSVWDTVPQIGATLSASDFEMYALPYCGHRERLTTLRKKFFSGNNVG